MRKKMLFLMCLLLMFVGATPAALILHLDATKVDSIVSVPIYDTTDPNNLILLGYEVTDWLDLSGAGNHAKANFGTVIYPSPLIFSGGFAGTDFSPYGTAAYARMVLFTAAESDSFLDFTPGNGAAAANSGVTILAAMRDDSGVNAGRAQAAADVLANKSGGGAGIAFRYNDGSASMVWRFTDTTGGTDVTQNGVIPEGSSVVQAVRLNNEVVANNLTMSWASSNGAKGTRFADRATVGDFSNANPVWLGTADNVNRYFDGAIGEVLIYNESLSDTDYQYQIDRLERKWVLSRAVAPLDGGQVIASPTAALSWLNLLPVVEGGDVTVDVWFGTEPNRLTMTLIEDDVLNLETTTVDASTAGQIYYWAVDTRFGSGPVAAGDPNTIEGPFYIFAAVADPAPTAIDAGPNYITWPNEGVPINATVTDEGDALVTVTFTANDPNVVFIPNPVVIAGGGGVASTTATIDYNAPVNVVVTATAEDDYPDNAGLTVSDTMLMVVYSSACQAERLGRNNQPRTDIAIDCEHNLADLAALAAVWLESYAAEAAFPAP